MAAVALQDTTLQQLEKIIEVVGQKSVALVEGIKTSVAPKLNETIAQVIDDFKSGGLVKQNKAIEMLMEQMKKLGLSVDDLTKNFQDVKEIPAGLKSLQDAMRFREKSAVEAEEKVQELRKAGVIAEIEVINGESKVNILSQKEVIQEQKQLVQDRKELQKLEKDVSTMRENLVKVEGEERAKAENDILDKSKEINEERERIQKKEEALQGNNNDIRSPGRAVPTEGLGGNLVMQLDAIVDSIKAPFIEIGELAKGIGKTFINFGKAFKTPIKSLKLFGLGLLSTIVAFLPIIAIVLAVVAALTIILFKFAAIKEGVGRFIDYLGKLPAFLKEKWDAFTAYIGGLRQSLVDKWDQFTAYISEMGEYVKGIGPRILDSIKSAFSKMGDYIKDIFKGMYNAIARSKLGKILGMKPVALSSEVASDSQGGDESAQGVVASVDGKVTEEKSSDLAAMSDTSDKNLLLEEKAGTGNTNVITVQQNQPVNNTQNVGSTGMVTQNNGANPDKGSTYEKLGEFA
jgi:hypothetical protein|tara:strand:- start:484 stop:2031 length:1548 start_codon:yes stop_codon:yes gene_type:complete